jgi:hypothetical protein
LLSSQHRKSRVARHAQWSSAFPPESVGFSEPVQLGFIEMFVSTLVLCALWKTWPPIETSSDRSS